MRNMYKLYNPETKRVIMTWGVEWADCKMNDLPETLKMFYKAHKDYLVTGI